jgi:enoyl-CoA hydratase
MTLLAERRLDGRVAVLTFDAPRVRNAISADTARRLDAELERHERDPTVGCIVVTGSDPAFCGGLDLRDVAAGRRIPLAAIARIAALTVPVIAAINGPAATGGLELALACPLRIASERAWFIDRHAQLGMFPSAGLSVRAPRAMGLAAALDLSLTGRRLTAEEALAAGLVSRVVAHVDLLPEALAMAEHIVEVGRELSAKVLRTYREGLAHPLPEALELEAVEASAWREHADLGSVAERFRQRAT